MINNHYEVQNSAYRPAAFSFFTNYRLLPFFIRRNRNLALIITLPNEEDEKKNRRYMEIPYV